MSRTSNAAANDRPSPKNSTSERKKSSNAQRREARSVGWAALGRAYEIVGDAPGSEEFDDPVFVKRHPWVTDLVAALRFFRTETCQVHLADHLNVFVSIPDDLDDLDLWPALTNIIETTSSSVRRLEERQQEVVLEARRQGVTWTEIGKALGTTRQSAWARYSGED